MRSERSCQFVWPAAESVTASASASTWLRPEMESLKSKPTHNFLSRTQTATEPEPTETQPANGQNVSVSVSSAKAIEVNHQRMLP